MMTVSLTSSMTGKLRYRTQALVGSLPHEDESWTWADAQAVGLEWADFRYLCANNVIGKDENGEYQTPLEIADKVREYAARYEVEFEGDDPLARL